ncbi:MAG: shikimate dehydrogenase, partial [Segetibacter sp.]|nr:shikimate dehydrogenase [Segetibacter sp.]
PFLHAADNAVQQIEACNCMKIKQGKLFGFNTDVAGFQNSLLPLLKPHHTHALILGTGGAAVAVEYALKQLGISYLFVTRDKAGKAGCISYDEVDHYINQYTLLINTTPTGTFPNINECPSIPYDRLTSHHYLFDLVYNPAETLFLSNGKKQGATIKNGEQMLHIQAEESWRIWNDDSL